MGIHDFNWKQKLRFHISGLTTAIDFNMEHAQL